MTEENLGTQETVETQAPEEVNPLLGSSQETVVENKEEVKSETPNVVSWPEDWRQRLTKDEKELARLQRLTDPSKVWEAYRNLETKMSSGKMKPVLSDNPTPEELSAYRKANNIPEKAEDYYKTLPEGLVIGEEDKPALNLFAERLHGKNVSPDVFNTVMETAFELIELNQQEAVAAQMQIKQESRQKLYETWGPAEYKMHINAISNVLASMPESLRNRFEGAQLADGTLMFNDAEAMQWWAQHVRETNPSLGVVPAGTGDPMQSIEQELAANRQMMRNPSEWFNKANADRRARHTQLLETLDKMKRRA